MSYPTFTFTQTASLSSSPAALSARCGFISISRHNHNEETESKLTIQTPGLLACTSRGVVPHLSADNVARTSIGWVHVPFETFLEHDPPVPTLQPGDTPIHSFLGFPQEKYLVSMSLRDPADGREMPANTNAYVTANCIRGVRKITPNNWRNYALACKPDIIFALSDTPFTSPPYSQKRLTKSIERSAAWIAEILRSQRDSSSTSPPTTPNVFVHMAGGASPAARTVFAGSLLETLHGKEAEVVMPLTCLDEGVAGYTFDLVPLKLALQVTPSTSLPLPAPSKILSAKVPPSAANTTPFPSSSIYDPSTTTQTISHLIRTSLSPLPSNKPRLITAAQSPHEILYLIRDAGIDLFDTHWAQRAADVGVALDFVFPAPASESGTDNASGNGTNSDLGRNLYDVRYRHDFRPLSDPDSFPPGSSSRSACPCAACSPVAPPSRIKHSIVDSGLRVGQNQDQDQGEVKQEAKYEYEYRPPYTRAYLHHLLHTHEMSAHTLLVMHNLAVMERFFEGVRDVVRFQTEAEDQAGPGSRSAEAGNAGVSFAREVERFCGYYDGEDMNVFKDARRVWEEVDKLRGKGRLVREKEKAETEATFTGEDEKEKLEKELNEKGVEGGGSKVIENAQVVGGVDETSLGTMVAV